MKTCPICDEKLRRWNDELVCRNMYCPVYAKHEGDLEVINVKLESVRRKTFEQAKEYFLQLSNFSDDDISAMVASMREITYEDFIMPDESQFEDDERVTQ